MPHRVLNNLAGMLGGGFASIMLNIKMIEIIEDGVIRLLMTIVIGVFGGIAGLAGKDIYTNYIKDKFKRK